MMSCRQLKTMMNNIRAYEKMATAGGDPLAVALDRLSRESGMAVNHAVWSKWRSGKRTPPASILRIINRAIAAHVLRENDIRVPRSNAALDAIAESFSPPERIAG